MRSRSVIFVLAAAASGVSCVGAENKAATAQCHDEADMFCAQCCQRAGAHESSYDRRRINQCVCHDKWVAPKRK